jgi:hypothetical protein
MNQMKKTPIALILLLAIGLVSCEKTELEPDYFVFGHFFGFCAGEQCIEIFKVEDGKLYEDNKDTYPSQTEPYEGNWTLLADSLYQSVTHLEGMLPQGLVDTSATVIGVPDAYDQGGLYIGQRLNGEERFWLLDLGFQELPAYMQSFRDSVFAATQALQ